MCYTISPMATRLTPIDISNMPDLVRIVEEVKTTNQPRILQQDNELVGVNPICHTEGKVNTAFPGHMPAQIHWEAHSPDSNGCF